MEKGEVGEITNLTPPPPHSAASSELLIHDRRDHKSRSFPYEGEIRREAKGGRLERRTEEATAAKRISLFKTRTFRSSLRSSSIPPAAIPNNPSRPLSPIADPEPPHMVHDPLHPDPAFHLRLLPPLIICQHDNDPDVLRVGLRDSGGILGC